MKSILLTLATLSFVMLFSLTNINAQSDPYNGAVDAKLLRAPAPEYPDVAKKVGIGGKVSVRVALDENGNVTGVESVSGPGSICPTITYPHVVALREAARAAALKAKFAPASRDGKPVLGTAWIDFDFARPAPETPADTKDRDTLKGVQLSNEPSPNLPSTAGRTKSTGLVKGKAVSMPKPPYPPAARPVRAAGVVSVRVVIDENGSVFTAEAISGHPFLRPAATAAACKAQFTPTLLEGKPVKVSGIITYNFVP
jgi:TonB family protein